MNDHNNTNDLTPAEIAAEWAELGVYEQEILMGTFPQRVEFVTGYHQSLIQKGYVNVITRIDHRFGQASLTEKGKALIDWLNDTPPAETQGDDSDVEFAEMLGNWNLECHSRDEALKIVRLETEAANNTLTRELEAARADVVAQNKLITEAKYILHGLVIRNKSERMKVNDWLRKAAGEVGNGE